MSPPPALASCAHVKELVRTKQGQFTLDLCLREEQWTLQHLLQSLQPCPGSGVNGETVNLSTPVPILGVEAGPDQRGDL